MIGWGRVDVLVRATCGYEDDVVCVKVRGEDDVTNMLRNVRETRSLRRVWKRVCVEPWWRLSKG